MDKNKSVPAQTLKVYLKYVSAFTNQTRLVEHLLEKQIVDYDDIFNFYDPEINNPDEPQEIFQWLVFPNFMEIDYDKLKSAGIPVLETDLETWVGITSFGSHYDLYVYPELINALFDLDISYEDIESLDSGRF